MRIKEYKDDVLGEIVYCGKHKSGLEVRILPKEDYSSAYALFSVKYGSIDTFLKQEDGSFKPIPAGTAHFLEHKLFESEELDAFELFSRTGAYSNAFTSFEQTSYLFKGSENITTSLGYLLDFVQNPYFTADTVKKEQGIIGQEIRMYQDSPEWMVFFNLLRGLYKNNPVNVDIAGTQESIAEIDDKLLYSLYDTFYNPSNMILTIVGSVDPDEIFDIVEKSIIRNKKEVPERKFVKDPVKSNQKLIEKKLAIGNKQFMLGYKFNFDSPLVPLETELSAQILIEILFGKSSAFYNKLLNEGLIDTGFSGEFFNGYGYAVTMVGGSSDKPEMVADLIRKEIKRVKKEGLDKEAFSRVKKMLYGSMIMNYNDIGSMASLLTSLYFNGYKPFDEIKAVKKITLANVQKLLDCFDDNSSTVSIIRPIEGE